MKESDQEITLEILEQFKMESRENIGLAEAALLSLEKPSESGEAIHELFRSIHTIKGSADYLGLKNLKELSHAFENILDRLRKLESISISAEETDLFFDVLDVITSLIAGAPESSVEDESICSHFIKQLGQLKILKVDFNNKAQSTDFSISPSKNDDKTAKIFRDTVSQQYEVLVRAKKKLLSDQLIDSDLRGMVSRALQCISNASQFVGEEEFEAESIKFKNWVSSLSDSKDIQDFIIRLELYMPIVQEVLENTAKIYEEHQDLKLDLVSVSNIAESSKALETKTVRVNQDVLDGFMNLVGELIVARNAFSHIQSKLLGTDQDRLIALKEFRESSNRLTQITGELQRNVMEMRMLPIKTLFERYPRIVRDVCRKTGKAVEVVFEGENTEIDKGIADQISEPLIHIVRNAVDHGIESIEERKKSGKSEAGTLIMKASHQGNFMVIEVIDDGSGINVEKIKSKIIERGLLGCRIFQAA